MLFTVKSYTAEFTITIFGTELTKLVFLSGVLSGKLVTKAKCPPAEFPVTTTLSISIWYYSW